jgi:Flp pilus assembly protein TadG
MRSRPERGQALVEFALVLPIFTMFVFATIQLALVFVAYYSETRMARETARYLAVNSSVTDLALAQHVQSTMLPGLVNGSPTLVTAGSTAVDTVYTDGRMTIQFTPCVPSGSTCSHTNRAPGATIYVQMSYDITNLLFLPSTFRMGSLTAKIPTSLPPYRVYVMTE